MKGNNLSFFCVESYLSNEFFCHLLYIFCSESDYLMLEVWLKVCCDILLEAGYLLVRR